MILHLPSSSFFDLQQHHLITILMSKQYPHHLRKWMYDMHGWITKTERKKERGKTRTGRRRRRRKRRMRGQEKEMGKGIRNAYNAATLLTSDWLYWTYTRKKRIIHRKEKRKKKTREAWDFWKRNYKDWMMNERMNEGMKEKEIERLLQQLHETNTSTTTKTVFLPFRKLWGRQISREEGLDNTKKTCDTTIVQK